MEMKSIVSYIYHNDTIKENWCMENNIKLIVIPYTKFKEIEEVIKREVAVA